MNTSNERRVLAEGKHVRLVAQSGWEWAERIKATGAAVIAAVTDDDRLVLVEQYRIPVQCRVLDLPAGLAGDEPGTAGEAIIGAARRELFEETYSLFVVRGARKTGPGGGDAREKIEVHVVPLAELDAWLDAKRQSGVMIDPKIYLGRWFLAAYACFRGST
jgi:ADP-ribose pyrophosphatase